jgi:3-deoxy-7-phosphoheptulonate synthase
VADIARQLRTGDDRIIGAMIESNLVGGRQDLIPGRPLVYGRSITDGCIDWARSEEALDTLAAAVRERRRLGAARSNGGVAA